MSDSAKPSALSRLGRWPLAAAAVLLLVAVSAAILFRSNGMRDKGNAPGIELKAFGAKKVEGKPAVKRQLASGDKLEAGEHVLFRFRLLAPAYVYLVIKSDRGEELAFSTNFPAPMGEEQEVAGNGQSLALDPAGMGDEIEIYAIASPAPLAKDWLRCSMCGRAYLELEPPE